MKRHRDIAVAIVLMSLSLSACQSDDTTPPYPNVVTEIANIQSNDKGVLTTLTLDNSMQYTVQNRLTGYPPRAIFRVMCGYVVEGENATLYNMSGVYSLSDSTARAQRDPVRVQSVWRTPTHVNLHLSPKTQGGKQYWGFITDSIVTHTEGGQTHTHAYLSLHHNQHGDPTSYTREVYASLALDSLKGVPSDAPITLRIQGVNGIETFLLTK